MVLGIHIRFVTVTSERLGTDVTLAPVHLEVLEIERKRPGNLPHPQTRHHPGRPQLPDQLPDQLPSPVNQGQFHNPGQPETGIAIHLQEKTTTVAGKTETANVETGADKTEMEDGEMETGAVKTETEDGVTTRRRTETETVETRNLATTIIRKSLNKLRHLVGAKAETATVRNLYWRNVLLSVLPIPSIYSVLVWKDALRDARP